jgi:hypothetical protein
MRGARPSALGQELRYRPRPPTVRCSTDSGHIAAPPRTGVWGHNLPRTLLRAYWRSAYALRRARPEQIEREGQWSKVNACAAKSDLK